MNNSSPFALAAFSGNLELIDKFYSVLGIEVSKGIVKFKNFEIIFGDEVIEGKEFQIVVEIDGDLNQVEKQIMDLGHIIINDGFDTSGPFFVTTDPAGLSIRVALSQKGLSLMAKNSE